MTRDRALLRAGGIYLEMAVKHEHPQYNRSLLHRRIYNDKMIGDADNL